MADNNNLTIGLVQISPIWLDKIKTTEKIVHFIDEAGTQKCDLVVFGEALLPGYPYWLGLTHGADFNSEMQKKIHAHYVRNAVQMEKGDLDPICRIAKERKTTIYLGIVERAGDRGGHSLYCSLIYISSQGEIKSVHRKLQPTYEERLTWSPGDGHGLVVHPLKQFTVGGLNCWENWMPLSRTSLYAMGEDLHVAVWPGSKRNTADITRFIALESRSFVVSVSGLMGKDQIRKEIPFSSEIKKSAPATIADGGSCVAGPDGEWILEPVVGKEDLFTATIDFNRVLEERQNFDPAGHYSRPDVTRLLVNRERQSILDFQLDNPK